MEVTKWLKSSDSCVLFAESLGLKHQRLITNRSRLPTTGRTTLCLCNFKMFLSGDGVIRP